MILRFIAGVIAVLAGLTAGLLYALLDLNQTLKLVLIGATFCLVLGGELLVVSALEKREAHKRKQ
jgi:hypothetical protein